MKKIGLIYYEQQSDWTSCNSILNNIISSYLQTGSFVHKFPIYDNMENLADEIIGQNLTHMAFIDHRDPPAHLLYKIYKKYPHQLPQLIIHVYGDFVLRCNQWKGIEPILKKFRIHFICASTAQSGVLKKLFQSHSVNIQTIPFPVNPRFKFSEEARRKSRENLGITSNAFTLCYTGRISLQKNVMNLLIIFKSLTDIIPDLNLLIAGPFDDIGIPYLGLNRLPLTMETEFYTYLESLSPHIKNKISYLGNLTQENLLELYHAADLYLSLSTHNDEDFGMAPAEAFCSGLPLFLTNWGGFKDFKLNAPGYVQVSDVNIGENRIKPEVETRNKILKAICSFQNADHEKISSNAQTTYSTPAVSNQYLKTLHLDAATFNGFNDFSEEISPLITNLDPFSDSNGHFNEVYFKLYDSY
jgi:glycosyltransferase involved in cell wall biosynthesis